MAVRGAGYVPRTSARIIDGGVTLGAASLDGLLCRKDAQISERRMFFHSIVWAFIMALGSSQMITVWQGHAHGPISMWAPGQRLRNFIRALPRLLGLRPMDSTHALTCTHLGVASIQRCDRR